MPVCRGLHCLGDNCFFFFFFPYDVSMKQLLCRDKEANTKQGLRIMERQREREFLFWLEGHFQSFVSRRGVKWGRIWGLVVVKSPSLLHEPSLLRETPWQLLETFLLLSLLNKQGGGEALGLLPMVRSLLSLEKPEWTRMWVFPSVFSSPSNSFCIFVVRRKDKLTESEKRRCSSLFAVAVLEREGQRWGSCSGKLLRGR